MGLIALVERQTQIKDTSVTLCCMVEGFAVCTELPSLHASSFLTLHASQQ